MVSSISFGAGSKKWKKPSLKNTGRFMEKLGKAVLITGLFAGGIQAQSTPIPGQPGDKSSYAVSPAYAVPGLGIYLGGLVASMAAALGVGKGKKKKDDKSPPKPEAKTPEPV